MDESLRRLNERAQRDRRTPLLDVGTVLAVNRDGSLSVSLGGPQPVTVAADRMWPAPPQVGWRITVLHADAQFCAVGFPAPKT